ncbi:MAG: hypothetical protein HRT90_06645 [Candidatus Margulisbacteria bacterium]|nr:hypothetical protein [Candidatus Margulisiibacteriota bacterium]
MENDKKYLWDNPRNIRILLGVFFVLCVGLFMADFVVYRKVHLKFEEWPGFYAVFGFVACVILVLVSKYVLRPLVKRPEDYYDH